MNTKNYNIINIRCNYNNMYYAWNSEEAGILPP